MPRTIVDRGAETDAVLATLTAGGVLTGDAVRPAGGGFPGDDSSQPFTPYAVLYQGITHRIDGPVLDPNADTVSEYQVTSIGVTRGSASVIALKVKTALLGTAVTVPGRRVQLVEWIAGQPCGRDDDVTPPLFFVVDIYAITSSPA